MPTESCAAPVLTESQIEPLSRWQHRMKSYLNTMLALAGLFDFIKYGSVTLVIVGGQVDRVDWMKQDR